ncbi:MAG TPA: hypothetical protein VL418_13675 [Devosiaceae bacterium]|jgi:hypothetical protein|nr:hypothetical protein [Devosiaceae bacterium]
MMDIRIAGFARGLRFMGAGGLAVALSACSMNMFGGGPDSPSLTNASASPAQIAAGQASAMPALATSCPPIKIMPGADALFFYGNGKAGDPESLHYQVGFEKQTRNCVVSNGLITVKMGVVGRVLLGPAGKETSVKVPLRFSVDRDGSTIFSDKYTIPVEITPPAQSADFVKVVDNVAIPYIGGEDITIWVGFDDGKTPSRRTRQANSAG